jgi:hypothetical protein
MHSRSTMVVSADSSDAQRFGVNPGVGPSRRVRADGAAGEPLEDALHLALNRPARSLPLPADILPAVELQERQEGPCHARNLARPGDPFKLRKSLS